MRIKVKKELIPWAMAFGRVGLGPVPIGGAVDSWNGFALAGIVIAALVSDIYDGILARRWHCDTAVGVFASHRENALVPLSLSLGILCDLEGLLISLIMPVWRKDINTLRAAWKLRKVTRHQEFISSEPHVMRVIHGQNPHRNMRGRLLGISSILVLSALFTVPTFAVEAGQVMYASGTLSVAQGTIGSLDIRVPTTLVFKFAATSSGLGEIDIPYDKITGFVYRTEVAHHIGVLPAIAVTLVKRRERKHYFTINFNDSSGTAQVAIFEVPKQDPPALLATLRARSPQACKPANCMDFNGAKRK
jgi:hypothetical protein